MSGKLWFGSSPAISAMRLFGGNLAWFVFWGYQLFIVMAASGYLLGITQSREYADDLEGAAIRILLHDPDSDREP